MVRRNVSPCAGRHMWARIHRSSSSSSSSSRRRVPFVSKAARTQRTEGEEIARGVIVTVRSVLLLLLLLLLLPAADGVMGLWVLPGLRLVLWSALLHSVAPRGARDRPRQCDPPQSVSGPWSTPRYMLGFCYCFTWYIGLYIIKLTFIIFLLSYARTLNGLIINN